MLRQVRSQASTHENVPRRVHGAYISSGEKREWKHQGTRQCLSRKTGSRKRYLDGLVSAWAWHHFFFANLLDREVFVLSMPHIGMLMTRQVSKQALNIQKCPFSNWQLSLSSSSFSSLGSFAAWGMEREQGISGISPLGADSGSMSPTNSNYFHLSLPKSRTPLNQNTFEDELWA